MRDHGRQAPDFARAGRFEARWEAAYYVVRARIASRSQGGLVVQPDGAAQPCDAPAEPGTEPVLEPTCDVWPSGVSADVLRRRTPADDRT